ncbi:MAG: ATP-binding cassette domain-containing protein [Candidatus Wallbacteria bacterium]|nr:ATP-binding cassette domain-containing protein [Candidatus Wallbacteria bacterium]
MLKVSDLCKSFSGFSLKKASFEVAEGELFVMLGPSGVGKTVLLECLAGLERVDSGSITLDGKNITCAPIQERSIGLVYQDQALFPHLTVWENLAYGLKVRGHSAETIRSKIDDIAEKVGVGALLGRRTDTLSGGEAQRVALGRTMAVSPRCLLLDEPISSLDARSRSEMRRLIRELNRAGQTIIHVTHDFDEALSLASRIAFMEDGRVVQTGPPDEVFRHPQSEFVASFIGLRNFFRGVLEPGEGTRYFISGSIRLSVVTDAEPGNGVATLSAEEVVLSAERPAGSARNVFPGRVIDVAAVRGGIEIVLDVGTELTARISNESMNEMKISCGCELWASFKATAVKFHPG